MSYTTLIVVQLSYTRQNFHRISSNFFFFGFIIKLFSHVEVHKFRNWMKMRYFGVVNIICNFNGQYIPQPPYRTVAILFFFIYLILFFWILTHRTECKSRGTRWHEVNRLKAQSIRTCRHSFSHSHGSREDIPKRIQTPVIYGTLQSILDPRSTTHI